MRRISILSLLLLLGALPARPQSGFTVVSATPIKDPSGVPYVNCKGSASFVPSPSATQQALISGSTFQTDVPISSCDSFGNMTITLVDNSLVTDGHTGSPASRWRINISSQDGKTNFFCLISTAGNTQDITAAIQACAAPLPSSGGGSGAFSYTTITSSPTPVFNATTNTGYTFTLTSNAVATFGTPNAGTIYQLNLCENGVGGFTFTFPGNVVLPSGFSFNTAANACNQLAFIDDGTNWQPWNIVGSVTPAGNQGDVQIKNSGVLGASHINDDGTNARINESLVTQGPSPWFDVTASAYGGVSTPNTNVAPQVSGITVNINSGSPNATISSASTFANKQGVVIPGAGATNTMSTPGAPTVTTVLARTGTHTGDVVPGLTGATTYNYKIIAREIGTGYTAASSTGTVTTAPASLGYQTNTLTSCARANAIVTCLTSSPHGLVVGAEVQIIGTSDTTFNGIFNVATVPDNTHFTWNGPLDTRNGSPASTSATGGTVNYMQGNHLTWSAVTGAYQYFIYSDRGSPGTFNVIGVSQPTSNGFTAEGSLYFDDFGSPAMDGFTPPWSVPTTAPSVATNDALVTTIVSGAGTTSLTFAANASNSIAGGVIRSGADANILAACTAAGGSTVTIPAGAVLVTNSILDLSSCNPAINIAGLLIARDTIIGASTFSGTFMPIRSGAAAFTFESLAQASLFGHPGIHYRGQGGNLRRIQINAAGGNGQTAVVMEGGGGGPGFQIDTVAIATPGGNDRMTLPIFMRGHFQNEGAQFFARELTLTTSQAQQAFTPALYSYSTSHPRIESIFLSGRGVMMRADPATGSADIRWLYCQACFTSLISAVGPKDLSSTPGFNMRVGHMTNDSSNAPIVTQLQSLGSLVFSLTVGDVDSASTIGYSGVPATFVSGLAGQNFNVAGLNNSGSAIDGIFNTANAGNPYGLNLNDAALATGGNYPIFVDGPSVTNVVATAAGGGGVPNGTYVYSVYPVWQNGGDGHPVVSNSVVIGGGNNTVNLTWTPLGAAAGCIGYRIARNPGGSSQIIGVGSFVSGCGTGSMSDTSGFTNGPASTVAAGGPSMLMPNVQGVATTQLILPNGSKGTLVPTTLTANRTWTLPDASLTVAGINVSQTFTGTQTFSTPIAVGSGGSGLSTATTNGILFGNAVSAFGVTAAGGAGTLCLTETNGGVPIFGSCSGSTSTAWSSLTAPGTDLSLNMSTFNSLFTHGVITGTRNAWEIADGASTSTGSLLNLHTGASSTMKPLTVTAQGTANGVQMSSAGVLAKFGSGSISADVFTGLATVPVGGTGQTTLPANQLLSGNGTSPVQSVAGSTTGTNPILKLQPSNATNTALILDTAASPSGDIQDWNINGVKTSWMDSAAVLHTPQATYTGSGPLALSGNAGTCPATGAGLYILCIADSVTSTIVTSLNGANFKPLVQSFNANPVAHAPALWGTTFPQQTSAASAGTTGQAFLSAGASADGGFGALNLAGGSTIFTGNLPTTNGGTGAASLAAANIVTVNGAITIGHCAQFQNTTVVQDSGGTCGGAGGAPPLHTITAATNTNTINSTTFSQTWNWALTGSTTAFKFGENTAATGAGNILLQASTAASSTAIPFQTDNNGNGYQLGTTGLWKPLGTGAIATPGAAHNIVVSQAGSAAVTYVPPVAAGKVLIDNGPGNDPSFQDPIVSLNTVVLFSTISATGTQTSTAQRVSTFSQYGTFFITFASITGSPSGCTLQVKAGDSAGNLINNGGTVGLSVANGTSQTVFNATIITAFEMQVVYACSVYPSTGTLTLEFSPAIHTNTNVTSLGSNLIDTNSGNKSGGTQRMVLATDQPNLTTPLNVALAANQSTNVAQLAGTTTDTNSGNKSAGTLRVVIATDQPQLTNKLLVTPDSVALPANQSVNVSQMNGVTTSMNNGTTDTGTQRVTLSSDSTGQVIPAPTTASGDAVSVCNILSAASTNSTSCKGSAGNFYGYEIFNTTTTVYYLRLYNSSSAPTCSSATGFIRSIPIPPAGASGQVGGAVSNQVFPVNYGTGIGYCITGGSSSTDNTNAATGVFGEIRYK